MKKRKLSVVVPTFNEKDNIRNLLTQIDEALKGIPYEVVFVDDSKDDTPELLMQVSKEDERVRFEHRVGVSGLATAVIRGFELAKGDYIAVMDADLQHPPITLRYMYAAMCHGAEFCIPSRFIPGGSDGGLNIVRKFISGTARYIGKIFLKPLRSITDPTSGLFMFKKEIIEGADLRPIGWKIMVEVIAMAHFTKVIELPYKFQERTAGESKLSSKVSREYIKQVFSLRKRAVKNDIIVKRWSPEHLEKRVRELDDF